MAKTKKKRRRIGRQAPLEVWSPKQMMDALKRGTLEDKIRALRDAGIIDSKNRLTKRYTDWGSKVTRTPDLEDMIS